MMRGVYFTGLKPGVNESVLEDQTEPVVNRDSPALLTIEFNNALSEKFHLHKEGLALNNP